MTLNFIVPEILIPKLWLFEKHIAQLKHPLQESVKKLILISDYAAKHIKNLNALLNEDNCDYLLTRQDYFTAIKALSMDLPLSNYLSSLRHFRHRHFLRLLILETSQIANTQETMSAWSDCADAIILHTLRYCQHLLHLRYGIPRDEQGNVVELFALAMGKLGGSELNYSSDIDLIFIYTSAGETDGPEKMSNQQFFCKVVQQFVQVLQNITADGFVFRVDLRLKPNGDSGALVSSLAAIETYYQEQGRDWERYAMVKARVITEDLEFTPCWFNQLIIPFTYRRYVDFSVIESLRSMKSMIEREIHVNPQLDDIKRGQGGIREIEFIIQSVQLIRGGRLPQLQQRNALIALQALKEKRLLPRCDVLKQAYLYLRQLENILQSLNDQQTHQLPQDEVKQAQITFALGYTCWDDLLIKLHQYQRIVSQSFRTLLVPSDVYKDEKRLLTNQLSSLWHGHIETNMAINLLTNLGFDNAEHCYQMLHSLRHGSRCRRLSQAARIRLDHFMVLLLTELIHTPKTNQILVQVMHLLDKIVGRSAYLALLTENPLALKELLFWFASSSFITSLFVDHPFLLEVLLDQECDWRPASRNKLQQLLMEKLSHSSDIEEQHEILRQFKLTHWLMAARAELYGYCTAVRAGQFLADVAQVIVLRVLDSAVQKISLRSAEIKRIKSHFAIVAYGKLGSQEMNYTSDLDLVFLYQANDSEEALVTRLTQKIIHMLTTRSQSGVLFSVDTRLRPSGSSGLLVSRLDAFIAYQKNQAWVWEHQALLKARVLFGSATIKRQFLQLKKDVFSNARDKTKLHQEVMHMRAKIEQHQTLDPLKHMPGGLLDMEFLIQFLALSTEDRAMAVHTKTLSQMKHLFQRKVITQPHYEQLRKAYQHYHYVLHHQILEPEVRIDEQIAKQVLAIYRTICHYT